MNGASTLAINRSTPKVAVDPDHLATLERGVQALAVFSEGSTRVQQLALKVAQGKIAAADAHAVLLAIG